ncbi:MAG: 50S ribosomal protein L30 [Pseudomonadota bacterium]|nr:50S ribosomal protein L30 [Alphaproteobacteria bacterium]
MAGKKTKVATAGTIKIKQIGSPIRRESEQRLHLKGLGLGKMNAIRELKDSPEVQGLIRKVRHMVQVISE